MSSGAHLGCPRPPRWAPKGREVSHKVVVIDRFHCTRKFMAICLTVLGMHINAITRATLVLNCRQNSNMNRAKSQQLNVPRLTLQIHLTHPFKSGVKSRTRCSWSSADSRCPKYTWVMSILSPIKGRLLLEIWWFASLPRKTHKMKKPSMHQFTPNPVNLSLHHYGSYHIVQ